jgi:hypothetical protein
VSAATKAPAKPAKRSRQPKPDAYLGAPEAQAKARAALAEISPPGAVGDFLGLAMEADRVGTLRFGCLLPGYVGWVWAVTMARVPRGRHATVSETELLPGAGALLSPAWVPWADRLLPGDLGPGDTLPRIADDVRLEPGYSATGEADEDQLAIWELGLGRPRVLSPEGRDEAAVRWYESPRGPTGPDAVKAGAKCSTCGFVTQLAGSLRTLFGVCANQWSPRDGSVVSYDHGCGAHSETDVARAGAQWPANRPAIDDLSVVTVDLGRRRPRPAPAAPAEAAAAPPDAAPAPVDAAAAPPEAAAVPVDAAAASPDAAAAPPEVAAAPPEVAAALDAIALPPAAAGPLA